MTSTVTAGARPETAQGPFRRDDLEWFPDDGNRYELLDGMVLVTSAPTPLHQTAALRLVVRIDALDVQALHAPVDVVFAEDTVLQPDICAWLDRWDPVATETVPIPDLVVEVSSPSTRRRDLSLKRGRYEAEGVPEFWFIDLREERVLVHELIDGAYVVHDGSPASSRLLDLTVAYADLLR